MIKKLLFFTLVIALVSGCSAIGNEPPLRKVRLPMGYIPNVQYAPFYMAVEKGYFAEAGLEIEFDYSFETNGVALVGANELPFAVVSGEQVLMARSQGLPVVYVLSWWKDYPVGVTTFADSGIASPLDLRGKKVGIPGLFGASYVGFRALLEAVGLSEADVTLDSIGFSQVEALTAGQEDAVVIYVNNEPLQLEARGYKVETIRVADYVHLASNGIISSEKVIAEEPELVQKLVVAFLKGVADVLADPQEAFEVSKKYVDGLAGLPAEDQAIQYDILLSSIEFWKSERLGYSDDQAWENMYEVLQDMELVPAGMDYRQAYTNEFIP
jgi:NitT/TauT family transport system substrate-binding protein